MKRPIEIEGLLIWAMDEMSKRFTSSAEGIWDQIAEYGQRGGVDVGHGAAQRYAHFGLPHPDAEKIEQAIIALPDAKIDWDAEAGAVMGDLIALADPRTRSTQNPAHKPNVVGWYEGTKFVTRAIQAPRELILVRSLRTSALVGMHAKLGTRPDWNPDYPVPGKVIGSKGKPVLIGECWGKQAYAPGSYCPLAWEPSPISIAESRADYLAWWRGLRKLASSLKLDDHVALPPEAPEMPWLEQRKASATHREERQFTHTLPLAPQRGRTRAPLRRRRNTKASMSF